MSWLKAIVGGVIGAEALNLVKDYIEKQGGIDAVVKDFQTSGFGRPSQFLGLNRRKTKPSAPLRSDKRSA